jgi:hypothetical protein
VADHERSPLVDEVLSGGRRELRLLAARGLLPLPIHELIEVQVALLEGDDEEVAAEARKSLGSVEPKIAAGLVAEGPGEEVVAFLAREIAHPLVTESVLRLRQVQRSLLVELAPRLATEMQEVLLLRQDAIVEAPEILDALEKNPQLSSYASRRIREYREHLLPRPAAPERKWESPEELEKAADALTEADVHEAVARVADEQPSEGAVEEVTGLSETQVRSLPMPVRLKLARSAPRSLRGVLIRDSNPLVATSVLKFNALSESEVEEISANRAVRGEVLQYITSNRSWMRRYQVVHNLVRNPRTPAGLAVRLLSRLHPADLKRASRDHNVPSAVRAGAGRLYRIKRS